ncbi:MAG UNVERIFIED_CONTAM: hypothetical protein LVT10_13460 [Anaerolineae bacterium]|jgi:dTDP-4-amino-4,6-dideoxygalactose transaminase
MRNLLAGVAGRAQLAVLETRIAQRTAIFHFYEAHLSDLNGFEFHADCRLGRRRAPNSLPA